jgi:hypothetical protein
LTAAEPAAPEALLRAALLSELADPGTEEVPLDTPAAAGALVPVDAAPALGAAAAVVTGAALDAMGAIGALAPTAAADGAVEVTTTLPAVLVAGAADTPSSS